ncbi:DUF4870 domain-containing protein [Arenibacter latericius]|uniref:DUF4870 domain-containing protein n=1 Tax=Arenibacter latericius TaxID=86104 RepID=UPI0004025169|nr:DUF4870 domain-containing protein [Arenibacter latericius]MDX1364816.1 DUF4870 domain-containing protein [Arenibacter latericius]
MTETLSKHHKNVSAIIHASTFSKYFIPFGNFILPLVLWTLKRTDHPFIDSNGKHALNFQISLLLYSICIGIITIPFVLIFLPDVFHFGLLNFSSLNEFNGIDLDFARHPFKLGRILWPLILAGLAQIVLFIVNIVYTILATIRTSEGINFKYPLTINFIT